MVNHNLFKKNFLLLLGGMISIFSIEAKEPYVFPVIPHPGKITETDQSRFFRKCTTNEMIRSAQRDIIVRKKYLEKGVEGSNCPKQWDDMEEIRKRQRISSKKVTFPPHYIKEEEVFKIPVQKVTIPRYKKKPPKTGRIIFPPPVKATQYKE